MEPGLVVIGVSYRTAPLAVRERFCMDALRRRQALELARADGVDEAVVLATCERTEFILWTHDTSAGAGSVLNFLTREYELRSWEWKHFYRLVEERALAHLMRLSSGLDAMTAGDTRAPAELQAAWHQARVSGASGASLDAICEHALAVGTRVREETRADASTMSVPLAAVELARQIFGKLENRRVLLIGAGELAQRVASRLAAGATKDVTIVNRTPERATALASRFRIATALMRERPRLLEETDLVISAVPASELALTRPEIEAACAARNSRPLLLIDLGMPRGIDPAARELNGVFLHDLDGLQEILNRARGVRQTSMGEADTVFASEARQFCSKLVSQRIVPIAVAVRQKLDQICRQELDRLRQETGALTDEQTLETFAYRISQRLAGSLARELQELPDLAEQERLTEAIQHWFRLEQEKAAAVAR